MNDSIKIWWRALRAYSFTATIIPVTCAFLYVRALDIPVAWPFFPIMLLCGLLLHAGTNLLNDYYDFTLGFDTHAASGSSGLLAEKKVPPAYMLSWGRLYLAVGCLMGMVLVVMRGMPMLLMGIPAIAGAFFYSHPNGYKYKGLGEPAVFLLMGPLLFLAAIYAAGGRIPDFASWPSIAFGCLVTAILLINNIRDLEMDGKAGFATLPMRLGIKSSKSLYILLIAIAFTIPPILYSTGRFNPAILLPIISLPIALRHISIVRKATDPAHDLKRGPQQIAALYMIYGILFAAGLLISG